MIDVFWLEQTGADLPASDDWLSASEALKLRGLRFVKRRADWKLGRWTAKRAVAMYLSVPDDAQSLAGLEIHTDATGAPTCGAGTLPAAASQAACPPTISISHREGRALCAVAAPQTALGCDLEIAEPRSDAFATDYFTAAEQERIAQVSGDDRWRLLALLWSAKESVLKALRVGLRVDTREVSIDPVPVGTADSQWLPLRATHEGRVFHGWWQQTGSVIRTLVADPAPCPPLSYLRT